MTPQVTQRWSPCDTTLNAKLGRSLAFPPRQLSCSPQPSSPVLGQRWGCCCSRWPPPWLPAATLFGSSRYLAPFCSLAPLCLGVLEPMITLLANVYPLLLGSLQRCYSLQELHMTPPRGHFCCYKTFVLRAAVWWPCLLAGMEEYTVAPPSGP